MCLLVKENLKCTHVRCFAHSLNLIVKDAVKATPELEPLIAKVKKVVNTFNWSAKATTRLYQTQVNMGVKQPLKLIQECETRWNSTMKMLQR